MLTLAARTAAALLLLAAPLAQAQEDDKAREDALFGAPAPEQTAPARSDADEAAKRESDLFGGGETQGQGGALSGPNTESTNLPPSQLPAGEAGFLAPVDEGALFSRLAAANDKLAIGGRMLLQDQVSFLEHAPAGQPDQVLTSPNLFDLYLDGRPSDRLRAYVRGRLTYTPTTSVLSSSAAATGTVNTSLVTTPGCSGQELCVALDQFWLKFDIEKTVFVTVGRQRIKWGAGRFWNPTDFMNQQRLNPIALFDQRLGVNLVKFHLPIESKSWNIYAIANLQRSTVTTAAAADQTQQTQTSQSAPYGLDEIGGALRAELLLGPVELTTSIAARKGDPLRVGADLSGGFWLIDWHAEGALIHPRASAPLPHYEGSFDLGNLASAADLTIDKQVGKWIPQGVIGADMQLKYSDEDSIIFGAEYFYNGNGYGSSDVYPLLFQPKLIDNALVKAQLQQVNPELAATPLDQRPLGNFFYLGRHYMAASASLPNPGRWNNTSFTLSWIGNLSDNSHLGRFDYRITLLTFMQAGLYAQYHFGGTGEFRPSFFGAATSHVDLGGSLLVNL